MMSATKESVLATLARIALPDGGDLVSRGMVRALKVDGGEVSFVIEAPSAAVAQTMGPIETAAKAAVEALTGVAKVSVV